MTGRYVDVAIDAAGAAGGRTYTYHVPERLADLVPGEAVLVDFGRRQALGVVLAEGQAPGELATRPVRERVRSDGPLLPPLQLALAREIAAHYLAPPAMVIRAMLPPGLFERLDLRARVLSTDIPGSGVAEAPGRRASSSGSLAERLLGQIREAGPGGIAVRELRGGRSRVETVRVLRQLEARRALELAWVLTAPGAGPRFERRVRLTDAGSDAGAGLSEDRQPPGRRLGPRQAALLIELCDGPADRPAAELAARFGRSAVQGLAARGFVELTTVEVVRRPLQGRPPGLRGSLPKDASMTARQAAAATAIEAACRAREARAYLLDGVTGAGKTAVYARAVATALEVDRSALVLVPEIALATPLVDRLRADLGIEVALLHGGLGEGERADEWRRIRAGQARVVVGTRSAVLAPLADPGVVIVDEEHEAGYKSDRTPRFQARDVALALGRLAGAPVVLGSATPDVATAGLARSGAIERMALEERPSGRLPDVEVVDLRAELAAGNRGLLSATLIRALEDLAVGEGERAILLINRRGAASVVVCRDCGYVQSCPECERPLVYHAAAVALRCHHCGAVAPPARRCPACGSPRIRYLGGGTERVEREVKLRFPALRVGRLDRDVAARRGAAVRVLDAFRDGGIDILVGTSMVAKGIDVPEVTLVGVVSADIALSLPDARASERTYQLLAQAVGRAGRGGRPGRAVIQSYHPDHPAIQAVARRDAASFYAAELGERAAFGFPPFGRLVKLTVAGDDREGAEAEARRMAELLRGRAHELQTLPAPVGGAAPLLGGTPPLAGGAASRLGGAAPVAGGAVPSAPAAPGASAVEVVSTLRGDALADLARSWPFAPADIDAVTWIRDTDQGGVEVLGPVPAFVARRAGRWRFHCILRGIRPLSVLGADPGPPWSVDVDPETLL